jgi:Fur family ferric uptake transcriptional regulator
MGITRRTKSVDLLLNEFEQDSEAISATTLISRLHSEINKSTIYRVLEKLEDDGVLHSFIGSHGIKWYAKCQGCTKREHHDLHPHFQCIVCGKTECLSVEVSIPELQNREVVVSQILIQGKCEECVD